MLLEQLQKGDGFTLQERLVAEYILNYLDQLEVLSASELAKRALASKATVVRLSQKLGLTGYQELKLKLIVEYTQQRHFQDLFQKEPVTSDSRYQDLIDILPSIYDKAVSNTNLSLSKQSINRIATYLNQADKIEIYATGVAYHLAQAAAFKFATLGREAEAANSLNHHYLASRSAAKRVVFLLSLTGNNGPIVEMARYLKEETAAYIVGIAGPYHTDLQLYCKELVEISNRDPYPSLDVISGFVAANYIFDLLFTLLLAKQYDKQVDTSLKMLERKKRFTK